MLFGDKSEKMGIIDVAFVDFFTFLCKSRKDKCKKIIKQNFFGENVTYLLDEPYDFCSCRYKDNTFEPLWMVKKIGRREAEFITLMYKVADTVEKAKKSKVVKTILESYKKPEITAEQVERRLFSEISKISKSVQQEELEGEDFILFYSKPAKKLALGIYSQDLFEKLKKLGEEYLK